MSDPGDATHDTLDPTVGSIGGQALVEGVMMRTGTAWAAAVRRDDGSIVTTRQPIPSLAGWRKVPLVRGAIALVESLRIGISALIWSTNERTDDPGQQISRRGAVVSVVVALAGALVIFGVGPAALAHLAGTRSSLGFNALEGAVRLALLFGYLLVLSRSAEMRRTFSYHGAEHMTIHALEHGRSLDIPSIRHFGRRHPRCGTSFLVVTVLVTVVVFSFLGRPAWPTLVASRVLGLPVIAGLSYELIRFAGNHRHTWYGNVLSLPGNLVQSITTREPDDAQIEVAVAALEAVLAVPRAPAAETSVA